MEFYSGLGAWYFLRLCFCSWCYLLLLCFCFVFRLARCRLCTHTLVLVGMSVSVCRDASLQFHAELWELMVMIGNPVVDACDVGSPVLPGRLFSSLCNQTRTLCWTSRVAREIVLQPLQSDTDALLDQPCCHEIVFRSLRSDKDALLDQPCGQGDCVPASTIRHGSLLHEERLMQLFLFGGTRAD